MEIVVEQNKSAQQLLNFLDIPSEIQNKIFEQHSGWLTESEMVSLYAHQMQPIDKKKQNIKSDKWYNICIEKICSCHEQLNEAELNKARRLTMKYSVGNIKVLLAINKPIRKRFETNVRGFKLLLFRTAKIHNYECAEFFGFFKDPLVAKFTQKNENVCKAIAKGNIDKKDVQNWFADRYFIPDFKEKRPNGALASYPEQLMIANASDALQAFFEENKKTEDCKLMVTKDMQTTFLHNSVLGEHCYFKDIGLNFSVLNTLKVLLRYPIDPNLKIKKKLTLLQLITDKSFLHVDRCFLNDMMLEQKKLVTKLIKYGADPLVKNSAGLTVPEQIQAGYTDEFTNQGTTLLGILQNNDLKRNNRCNGVKGRCKDSVEG